MTHITRRDIEALIDDELDHETSKRILNYINTDQDARKMYKELHAQKRLLKTWWNMQRIG